MGKNQAQTMKPKPSALLPSAYAPLLADLKARVQAAQVKAAVSVKRGVILLYWQIGRKILRAQKAESWGAKVVGRLAAKRICGRLFPRSERHMVHGIHGHGAIGVEPAELDHLGLLLLPGQGVELLQIRRDASGEVLLAEAHGVRWAFRFHG